MDQPRELDDPYTGKPASLAREMPSWLYHFAGYPLRLPASVGRDSLKTKALVTVSEEEGGAAFFAFSRQILQMFTGN
jgi:hypothetical protein